MTLATRQKKRGNGIWRIATLTLVIGALAVAWLAGWNWGAGEVERRTDRLLAEAARNGVDIDCASRRIEGFPFRIGIFCDMIAYSDLSADLRVQAGAFRSAAQFYAPGRMIAELDGPARLERRGGLPYVIDWDRLRVSARVGLEGARTLSLESEKLGVADGWAPEPEPFARVENLQIHARRLPDAEEDLDLAVRTRSVQPAIGLLPGFDLNADMQLERLAPHIRPGFDLASHIRASGLTGRIEELVLAPSDGGSIAVRGPFSIDTEGIVDAELALDAKNPAAIVAFLRQMTTTETTILGTLEGVFSVLAGPKGSVSNLALNIKRGEVRLGPVKLGEIPALPLR